MMLEIIVGMVGIVVTVVSIIVTVINIVQIAKRHKHQKATATDQSEPTPNC